MTGGYLDIRLCKIWTCIIIIIIIIVGVVEVVIIILIVIIIIIIIIIIALHPFLGPWTPFQFLSPIQRSAGLVRPRMSRLQGS
jgi:hypothetical protein